MLEDDLLLGWSISTVHMRVVSGMAVLSWQLYYDAISIFMESWTNYLIIYYIYRTVFNNYSESKFDFLLLESHAESKISFYSSLLLFFSWTTFLLFFSPLSCSIREICGKEDVDIAYKHFKAFYQTFSSVDRKLNVD